MHLWVREDEPRLLGEGKIGIDFYQSRKASIPERKYDVKKKFYLMHLILLVHTYVHTHIQTDRIDKPINRDINR